MQISRHCRPFAQSALKSAAKGCLFTLLLVSTGWNAHHCIANDGTIVVQGSSQAHVKADYATISFTVETTDESLAKARSLNEERLKTISDRLQQAGVEDKEIRANLPMIHPISPELPQSYGYGVPQKAASNYGAAQQYPAPQNAKVADNASEEPKMKFSIHRQVQVRVLDLKQVADIKFALAEEDIFNVQSINYRSKQASKYRTQTRRNAVRNAKQKATEIAEELGARITGVKSVREQDMRVAHSDPFAEPTVTDEEESGHTTSLLIQSSVEIQFEIAPNESK